MKRILTLAIAAMLVVAFAIPTFAAPKVELVSGNVETTATFDGGTPWGIQDVPTLVNLKFKFSADNFVFNVKLDPIAGELTDYDFSLALPYVTVSGYYDSYTEFLGACFGYYHGSRELRVASDEKFKEMAGFNWAVYTNDDNLGGAFDSLHAQLSIPVGEAFTATLNYAHDAGSERIADADGVLLTDPITVEHHANIDLSYSITDDLSVAVQAGKDITPFLDDFFFAGTVNFPVVEGISGVLFAQYGMGQTVADLNADGDDEYIGFVGDVDFNNYGGYWNGYYGDTFESYLDLNYVNENAHAELFVDYASASDFVSANTILGFAEYVSNGKNSWWSSGNRRANYADTADAAGRGWNTYFDWVRKNGGNEFAVRVNGSYNLFTTVDEASTSGITGENLYGATMFAMFAPDAVPVVLTFKGTYNHKYIATFDVTNPLLPVFTDDEYFNTYSLNNWIGVRLTEDIHLAIWDRYNWNNQTLGTPADIGFDVDAALVYYRDNVTFKVTGKNLAANLGGRTGEIYLGFSF